MAIEKKRKTNHQTGWHKRVVNPTLNSKADTHSEFCRRCMVKHEGLCPETNGRPSKNCAL